MAGEGLYPQNLESKQGRSEDLHFFAMKSLGMEVKDDFLIPIRISGNLSSKVIGTKHHLR